MRMNLTLRSILAVMLCFAVCLAGIPCLTGCGFSETGGRCVLPVFPFSAEGSMICGGSVYRLSLVFDSPVHGRLQVGDAVFLADNGVTLDAGGLLLPLSCTPMPAAFVLAVLALTPDALISCTSDGERVTAVYRSDACPDFGTIVLTTTGDRVVSVETEGFRMELSETTDR